MDTGSICRVVAKTHVGMQFPARWVQGLSGNLPMFNMDGFAGILSWAHLIGPAQALTHEAHE